MLSYSCTCAAVAEHLRIREDQVRTMATSSSEFASQFDPEDWAKIQDRSLAIERAQREEKREAEKRKQAAALAKVAEKQGAAAAQAAPAAKAAGRPVASSGPSAGQAAPKAKPKAKLPAAPTNKAPLTNLATGNRFGGFADDNSDDEPAGWTTVKR